MVNLSWKSIMKKTTFTFLAFAILFFYLNCSISDQEKRGTEYKTLREAAKNNFDHNVLIGGTTGSWAFGTPTGDILNREFGYVTPENDFKQLRIHPDPDTWNWEAADAWLESIFFNKQVLRIHAPIGPQCSNWANNDARTAEELKKNMEEFFPALCKRYNGKPGIISLDVVNEVAINGKWHTNKPGLNWENPWFIIGQDTDKNKTPLYIIRAFEIANEFAPDLKLIFNHHEETINQASWNLIKETIKYLRDKGLRVDGIGWQAHIKVGWETEKNLKDLADLIDWAHANNLEFHITEASVFLKSNTPEDQQKQARTYTEILRVLLEKRKTGVVGWNTWHIDDGHTWRASEFPSVFNSDYTPKPAYYSILGLLNGK
jgi:endo-1,4-beta-xylanase